MTAMSPSCGANAAHILVVDDDQRLRELLRRYLAQHGYRVTTAADAGNARDQMSGMFFDLVVLDVMMPGDDGLSFTRAVRQNSDVPILLLTARAEADDRIEGLQAGADDYLPKPFRPRELLLRMEAVLRRAGIVRDTAPLIRLGEHLFDRRRGELLRNGEVVHLTTTETQILRVLAQQPGTTLSRPALSATSEGSDRSVDVHVARLRRKIEPDPRNPCYLKTVWGAGYALWTD